jgi:hypothetical protein
MLCFASCEKDFVFKNDYQSSVPVLNCRFTSNQVFKVSLTTDLNIDSNKLKSIPDASISIYEDNVFFEKLVYIPHAFIPDFGYYYSTKLASANHVYNIKVSHPTFGNFEATDTIPSIVDADSISYIATYNKDSNLTQKLSFSIHDNISEENNYALFLFDSVSYDYYDMLDTIEYKYLSYINITKVQGVSSIRYFDIPYFNDKNFNGQLKRLNVLNIADDYYLKISKRYSLFLFIRNISKNYLAYEKSIYDYYNADLNAFEETPELYSNVKGARGIFCSYTDKVLFYRVK